MLHSGFTGLWWIHWTLGVVVVVLVGFSLGVSSVLGELYSPVYS